MCVCAWSIRKIVYFPIKGERHPPLYGLIYRVLFCSVGVTTVGAFLGREQLDSYQFECMICFSYIQFFIKSKFRKQINVF